LINLVQENPLPFRLHTAGRIEQFLQALPQDFLPNDLFALSPVWVIQNRNMGEWLKLELAERQGISAGLDIRFPEQTVRQYMDHFDHPFKEHTILFMDNLKVVIYRKLREILLKKSPVFRCLTDYLQPGETSGEGLETRLYQLADVIGGLFYHYGMNCIEMTACWEKGELYPCNEGLELEHQRWQMQLWQDLFHRQSPYVHLSRILTWISEHQLTYQGPENPLRLFGSSFLGETGIRFFHYLSRFLPVDFYYVIPSRILSPLEEAEAPMDQWEGWSSLARGLSGLLRDLQPEPGSCRKDPVLAENYLGSIQQVIWNNRPAETERPEEDQLGLFSDPAPLKPDESLKIFSAPSLRRQVEVLKDQLLALLDRQPDLQLNDICIMAPDINPFASHLERVFLDPEMAETRLPCNFIDLKREGDAVFTEGFLKLLELGAGRFSRSEVFSLFQNPCFAWQNRISEGVYKEWLEACEELNILWGIDGSHKASLGFPPVETNSWEWGFHRALTGMIYADDREHPCAPWTEIPESGFSGMGRLIYLVRSLYRDLSGLMKSTLPLEQWVLRTEELMERYLAPRKEQKQDQMDRLSIKMVFRNLNNLIEGLQQQQDQGDRRVPWSFFKQLLVELIGKTGRKKGHYLTQGISCSSLKPLRGIPFKVICLLGMDYSSFPSKEVTGSFDLKDLVKDSIDLSRRSSDKFSFLETLMSAREYLWIFYQGRSQISGETLLPSPVITELMDLAGYSEQQIIPLPLHAHGKEHFSKDSPLPSYDTRALERLKLSQSEGLTTSVPQLILNTEPETEVIQLDQLLRFFKNPLEQFARQELKLYLTEEELLEEHQDEGYRIPFLKERGFFKEAFPLMLEGQTPDPEQWMQDLRRKGILSHTPWDQGQRDQLLEDLRVFSQSAKQYRDRLLDTQSEEYLFVPGLQEPRRKQGLMELPALTVEAAGRQWELSGNISGFREGENFLEWEFLYGPSYKSRYGFKGFLHYLTLAAAGRTGQLEMLYLGKGNYPEKFWNSAALKAGETPRSILTELTEIYLRNRHQPIPLYPDLVDQATSKGKKKALWQDRDAFNREYVNKWTSDFGKGPDCPYGEMFFPGGADPGEEGQILLDKLYYYCMEITPEDE